MSTYNPTEYSAGDPHFWGQLLDTQGNPSEILCRFADALFFHVDANANVPYRNTGFIEPMKWAWLSTSVGNDAALSSYIANSELSSLYDLGSVPYKLIPIPNAPSIPVLDRRAWLHLIVWEFKAVPDDAFRGVNKELAAFNLRDPLTNIPFPFPMPTSAIQGLPINWPLKTALNQWQTDVRVKMQITAAQQQFASTTVPAMTPFIPTSPVGYQQQPGSEIASIQLQIAQAQAQQAQVMADIKKKQQNTTLIRAGSGLAVKLLTGNLNFGTGNGY